MRTIDTPHNPAYNEIMIDHRIESYINGLRRLERNNVMNISRLAYWLLGAFLLLFGLTFFGMAIPTILLGILAVLTGLVMFAAG